MSGVDTCQFALVLRKPYARHIQVSPRETVRRYDSLCSLSLCCGSIAETRIIVFIRGVIYAARCNLDRWKERTRVDREKDSGCASLTTKPDKRAHRFGNRCETMSIRAWHAGKGSGKWLTYFPRWIHPPWRRAKDWIGYSHKASHHSVSPRLSRACRKRGKKASRHILPLINLPTDHFEVIRRLGDRDLLGM